MTVIATLVLATAAFTLSASAGLGGSLVMVPALGLLLGTKQGVALASLLLACNNVLKVWAYRKTIPVRAAFFVLALTMAGAAIGARLLVHVTERWVSVAVIVSLVAGLAFERRRTVPVSSAMALFSGATSGFSGTSGPLKGMAIRSLGLDRLHFVGAASLVSLGGDLVKSGVYAEARLLDARSLAVAAAAVPLMVLGTATGVRITTRIGERAFLVLFWAVMAGYVVRLLT